MTEQKAPYVLIADDSRQVAGVIRAVLSRRGFRVESVDNGLKALQVLRQEPPDLLVLDIVMPGMNGLDLCRTIKEDPDLSGLPILMITSITHESDIADGFWKIGTLADKFVTKPFDPFDLADLVEQMLDQKGRSPDSNSV